MNGKCCVFIAGIESESASLAIAPDQFADPSGLCVSSGNRRRGIGRLESSIISATRVRKPIGTSERMLDELLMTMVVEGCSIEHRCARAAVP